MSATGREREGLNVHENVVVSHRGARFEIGRGQGFYGIWPAGAAHVRPIEWWPETVDGWHAAWSRFTDVERRQTIRPAGQIAAAGGRARGPSAIVAAVLLAGGVLAGVAGLFPGYFGTTSLAGHADQLVPHVIYLAAWAASAVLILLGGPRQRAGALLGGGLSAVTLGLFFADTGTAISGGGSAGTGLVLSLIGWAACAAGSLVGIRLAGVGVPGRPTSKTALNLALAVVAGVGAAIAFAPSWDRFTLRTAAGASQTVTAGNAFANPGLVIAGDVAVMAALVGIAIAAGLWWPARNGAALLAGAIVPMAAQAISAVVQITEGASPLQFGISPGQAASAGLSIGSGLTPAFWIYCAFVAALILTWGLMLSTPTAPPSPPAPAPEHADSPGALSPATMTDGGAATSS
jgi:hypothetical protein